MSILAFLILGLLPFAASADFKVGDQVLARWTNNLYYRGHVMRFPSSREIEILLTDGDRITHLVEDGTAVIVDEAPAAVNVRQHVLAAWSGEDKYYIGFIIDKISSKYKVLFDDGGEAWYKLQDLRVLPVLNRFQVGARVFAYRKWPDRYFYRGFVVEATQSKVKVYCDDRETHWYYKNDHTINVVLDEIPQKQYLLQQFVLAATQEEERYAYGRIRGVVNRDHPKPWAKHAYYVDINGELYWDQFYQIRQLS